MTSQQKKSGWSARLRAILLAVLCLFPMVCAADPSPPDLILSGDAASFPLRGHIARLEDATGVLSIRGAAQSATFAARPPDAEERDFFPGVIWYRFTVVRPMGAPAEWILAIGEPYIDDIRVFTPMTDGGFKETRLGRRVPNTLLPLAARRHVVHLDLPEGVPTTVLVRLASANEIEFTAELWHPDALLFVEARQSMVTGIVLAGSIFVFAIYTLFGVWLRNGTMLAYAFYVLTFSLIGEGHNGSIAMLFPGMGGSDNDWVISVAVEGNLAALTFMWDSVLNLRRRLPLIHRLYLFVGWAALLSLLSLPTSWHFISIRPSAVVGTALTFISMVLASAQLRQGKCDNLLKYYIVAFTPMLFFSLLRTMDAVFPDEFSIQTIRSVGTMTTLSHVAILCVALGHRITLLQRERLRAEAEVSSARAAMREYSDFVSMLGHQLRTPMAIISSSVSLLELDMPATKQTKKIHRAVKTMRDLTNDILADCRMAEAAETMIMEQVSLPPLLDSLLEERRDSSAQVFRRDFDIERALAVNGDRALLDVMFANLIDNAMKYSAGEGDICISLARANGTAAITIADNGPGIPPKEAERIFEKFYRSPATSGQSGTGLGLYLVRQIAHHHGGDVSLTSLPGRGAAFTVSLPLAPTKTGKPTLGRMP